VLIISYGIFTDAVLGKASKAAKQQQQQQQTQQPLAQQQQQQQQDDDDEGGDDEDEAMGQADEAEAAQVGWMTAHMVTTCFDCAAPARPKHLHACKWHMHLSVVAPP